MPLSSRALVGVALLVSAFASAPGNAQAEENPKVISDGNRVSIEYTLKLADGSTADTNVGGEALVYVQGESQILPALEAELLGLKVGDSKQVSLTAVQGYGDVDPGLFQTVPASAVPEGGRKVGTELVAQTPSGQRVVRVHEVNGEEIVMNLNHPLAGQALEFDIKIISIE